MSGATTKISDFELLALANKRIAELEAEIEKWKRHDVMCQDEFLDMVKQMLLHRRWARIWKKAAYRYSDMDVFTAQLMDVIAKDFKKEGTE